MRKADLARLSEGHLARYHWAKATRGRLSAKAAKLTALLRILEPELATRFPDSRSVNDALRALLIVQKALPRRRQRRPHAA